MAKDELRRLKARLRPLLNNAENLKGRIAEDQRKLNSVNAEINEIKAAIAKIEPTEIKVSAHAIVRFMERVKGIDLQQIKDEILTERTLGIIRTMGDGKYPIGDYHIQVKNNTIITII